MGLMGLMGLQCRHTAFQVSGLVSDGTFYPSSWGFNVATLLSRLIHQLTDLHLLLHVIPNVATGRLA